MSAVLLGSGALAAAASGFPLHLTDALGRQVTIEDAGSFDAVYAAIALVGWLTGHEQEASQVVQAMQARLARVRQAVATLPQDRRVTVFYEVYDEPLMTVGRSTIIGQLVEMAGGVNNFSDVPGRDTPGRSEEGVKR